MCSRSGCLYGNTSERSACRTRAPRLNTYSWFLQGCRTRALPTAREYRPTGRATRCCTRLRRVMASTRPVRWSKPPTATSGAPATGVAPTATGRSTKSRRQETGVRIQENVQGAATAAFLLSPIYYLLTPSAGRRSEQQRDALQDHDRGDLHAAALPE